jgi:hypothetical protein
MTLPAWDLDAPAGAGRAAPGAHPGAILPIAIGLAGLGLGALMGSALSQAEGQRFPATAALNVRDLYVDVSDAVPPTSPTPTTSASAPSTSAPASSPVGTATSISSTPSTAPSPSISPGDTGPTPRIANAVIVLRLHVDNPGDQSLRLTGLQLDGVTGPTTRLPLNLVVTAQNSEAVDLTLRPDCSSGRSSSLRGRLTVTDPQGSATSIPVVPSRPLSGLGGICSQLDNALPNGWQAPLPVITAKQQGDDLEITMADLSGAPIAGILDDHELLPTVFVGNQLVPSSGQLTPGKPTKIELQGPPPCLAFSGRTPIPSTIGLLAQGAEGVKQRLVLVGPALVNWILQGCGAAAGN